jgi:prepilin-type N-terminal cleavage/methylation domain-containing protein
MNAHLDEAQRSTGQSAADRDTGFTLVEMLVATTLFLLLGTMLLTMTLAVNRAVTDSQQFTNMNEQARVATERLSREMRQATEVRSATLPALPGGDTAVTFGVDFNGNNIIEDSVLDPEVITYRYDASGERLTLTANDEDGVAHTRPILSEQVTAFEFEFRSSLWQHDTNGDGITTWEELDASPVGNRNNTLDSAELRHIDLVAFTLTVMDGKHKQTYQSLVGLRNQTQN